METQRAIVWQTTPSSFDKNQVICSHSNRKRAPKTRLYFFTYFLHISYYTKCSSFRVVHFSAPAAENGINFTAHNIDQVAGKALTLSFARLIENQSIGDLFGTIS